MLELLFVTHAFAHEFAGYQMKNKGTVQEIEGRVINIVQSKTDYLIQIGTHPALYTFPKDHDKDQKIIKALERVQKEKKSLKAKVDLMNAKIISLEF